MVAGIAEPNGNSLSLLSYANRFDMHHADAGSQVIVKKRKIAAKKLISSCLQSHNSGAHIIYTGTSQKRFRAWAAPVEDGTNLPGKSYPPWAAKRKRCKKLFP